MLVLDKCATRSPTVGPTIEPTVAGTPNLWCSSGSPGRLAFREPRTPAHAPWTCTA